MKSSDLSPNKKIINWASSKLKALLCKTNKQIKTNTDWNEVFANHMSYKEIVSRMYKELSELNIKKTNNPFRKWEKDTHIYFIEEHIQTHDI